MTTLSTIAPIPGATPSPLPYLPPDNETSYELPANTIVDNTYECIYQNDTNGPLDDEAKLLVDLVDPKLFPIPDSVGQGACEQIAASGNTRVSLCFGYDDEAVPQLRKAATFEIIKGAVKVILSYCRSSVDGKWTNGGIIHVFGARALYLRIYPAGS